MINRISVVLIVLLMHPIFLFGQSMNYSQFDDKAGKGVTKIPMIVKSNSPLIEVGLDSNKIHLLLDIGGFAAINIDTSIARKFGYKCSTDSISSKNYKGETIKMNRFNIPKFQVGDFYFSDFIAQAGSQKNKTGYIGLSFFRNFKVVLDYRNSYLYLISDSIPGEFDIETWEKINFDYGKYGISTTINIDNKEFSFFWDTGARFSLLKPEFVDKNKITKRGEFDFYTPQSVQINNAPCMSFDFLIMDFEFPPVDGVIGHNFFKNKMLLIDFENKQIFIKR